MKDKLAFFVPLVLFFTVVVILFTGLGKDPTELDSQLIGKPIPEFKLTTLTDPGKQISQSDIKGPALLNVFASWCPSCYVEHPYFMELEAQNAIPIYGLNYKDERSDGLKFVTDLGNPYEEIIFDYRGRLGIDLGVYGAPETYLIDANNEIIYRHVGVVNEKVWTEVFQPLLGRGQGEDDK
jgi:cytochrome c biogenesis protein CcmG/thiol:disulfide interchange protein DsbE